MTKKKKPPIIRLKMVKRGIYCTKTIFSKQIIIFLKLYASITKP